MKFRYIIIIICGIVPLSLNAQEEKILKSYYEFELLPIFHFQNTTSENNKIKGDLIPNYQIGFTYRKFYNNYFSTTTSLFGTSFGNKLSSTALLDGNNVELGTGPNRQSGNAYYSFFVNAAFSNMKTNSPITVYIGMGISLSQVNGLYDSHTNGATYDSTGSSIGLHYDAYRTSKLGYFINFATDIRLFKIKKINSLHLKTGFLIGLKTLNELEVTLYENHISVDRAKITSKGSGIYIGLTYRWQKGRRAMEKIEKLENGE